MPEVTGCNSFLYQLYLKAITPLEKGSLGVLLATFCVVFKMGIFFDHSAELDLVSVKKTSMIWVFWFISIVQNYLRIYAIFHFDYYLILLVCLMNVLDILVILISYTFERQLLLVVWAEFRFDLTWLYCLQIDSEGFIQFAEINQILLKISLIPVGLISCI